MDEYVERAAIMEFPIRKDHCDKERANEHFIFGIESVLEYAQNLPAADVAPVVHGKWIRYDDGVITCSECGNAESSDSYYCRYCGAKMDGGAGNEID